MGENEGTVSQIAYPVQHAGGDTYRGVVVVMEYIGEKMSREVHVRAFLLGPESGSRLHQMAKLRSPTVIHVPRPVTDLHVEPEASQYPRRLERPISVAERAEGLCHRMQN